MGEMTCCLEKKQQVLKLGGEYTGIHSTILLLCIFLNFYNKKLRTSSLQRVRPIKSFNHFYNDQKNQLLLSIKLCTSSHLIIPPILVLGWTRVKAVPLWWALRLSTTFPYNNSINPIPDASCCSYDPPYPFLSSQPSHSSHQMITCRLSKQLVLPAGMSPPRQRPGSGTICSSDLQGGQCLRTIQIQPQDSVSK